MVLKTQICTYARLPYVRVCQLIAHRDFILVEWRAFVTSPGVTQKVFWGDIAAPQGDVLL